MVNVRQAVILGAGLGCRLNGVLNGRPKGFLQFGRRPIIEESIAKLIRTGINDVIIVTGYCFEFYDRLAEKYPFVRTIQSPEFATTGSMMSLCMPAPWVQSDFLLLESDLIYEVRALQTLQSSARENCILLSGKTGSSDEVYVGVRDNRVVNMSKCRGAIEWLGGELVGISKITRALYQQMTSLAAEKCKQNRQYQYEDCLTDLSSTTAIHYHRLENLAWTEIDNEQHMNKALNEIYPLIQRRDSETVVSKHVERRVLLNPGPATTTDTVKYALVVDDICPREKEFGDLVEGIRQDLVRIVHGGDAYEAVLFASSGTGAVEACLSSVVPHDKSVLIINNGAYGKRMQQICDGYEIKHIDYDIDWGEPLECNAIERLLTQHRQDISHLALVHHETTVGILNELSTLSHLAERLGVEVIVDAMSSYAGIPIDIKDSGIHYLVASANKCIQGMAGLSFVICKTESLEKTKDIKPINLYFNLYQNYAYFSHKHEMQFTPPVQVFYALRQAINEYFLETEQGRAIRYATLYDVLEKGLQALGFRFLLETEYRAKLLTAIIEPKDTRYAFSEMHDYLYERGFTIYPGKGTLQNTFRIATIGALTEQDIVNFLVHLEAYLVEKEIRLRPQQREPIVGPRSSLGRTIVEQAV
ncbi:MAG: 2-aminoethylphosphonate--pyruvate transaminase [Planctomycetes bacterium]|nr:2-aminoethylphosphonate--pyruvate transaminase [Planctomycetota bacterium]